MGKRTRDPREAEVIEYLWPRMGDYRRAEWLRYLICGDQESARQVLARAQRERRHGP
ncbi:MAG: hypothetical protein P8M73_11235 [Luminiphilus sp.]|jgi:hypothetical protein|nr:hypothetical protein [Luminiphilus sp.]